MSQDPAYHKATYRANSLILGGSRAGQGLAPQAFKNVLERHDVMLNFAFNAFYSPFGPAYLEAIRRKLDPTTEDGLFVISVNPGTLSDPDTLDFLREEQYRFYELYNMNLNPNVEYMLRDMGAQRTGPISPLVRLFGQKRRARQGGERIYHSDGWMAVPKGGKKRKDDEFPIKKEDRPVRNPLRIEYLKRTISFLQEHGQVVLVRIPAGEYFWENEPDVYPAFDEEMQAIADSFAIPYFNYHQQPYEFHDRIDHHLSDKGAWNFSIDLAEDIKVYQNSK
jgi:hypothetical protein